MPSGPLGWPAASDSPVFYRIKFPIIQIRPLSQKALICFPSDCLGSSSSSTGLTGMHAQTAGVRGDPTCTATLCSTHDVHIHIYKHTHSLSLICLASRERWQLFLRGRRDHTGIMLQHSVFAYRVSSVSFLKSTLRPFKKPSVIMKWNTVITFTRGFFQSRCSTHCQNPVFIPEPALIWHIPTEPPHTVQ